MGALIYMVLAGASVGLSLWAILRDRPLCYEFAPIDALSPDGAPVFEQVLDYTARLGQAHSPAIVCRSDGFSVLWFEGSAEAQADVDIYEARFTTGDAGWSVGEPVPYVTRGDLAPAMVPEQLVVTLGNTIEDEANTDGLFATVVSVGGWAMASVARISMGAGGVVRGEKLSLSPMANRSTLVKSPMVAMADGSHALPTYFEMGTMHGLWIRFDASGRVRDVRRMGGGRAKPIQPMVVPLDGKRAVAFLREFDTTRPTLLQSRTEDGGRTWSPVETTQMYNSSSPVAALSLGRARIVMAANDDVDHPGDLRLLLSEDGGDTWRVRHRFDGQGGALRYPMLRRLGNGQMVLSYSHSTKGGVRVHVLNAAWLEGAP